MSMTNSRWVDQRVLHDKQSGTQGDCVRASIASLLYLKYEEVPDFFANGADSYTFWKSVDDFLRSRGWQQRHHELQSRPSGYHLGSGPAARGVRHMVVMKGFNLVHDPHPSRAGLIEVDTVTLLVPLDPGAFRLRDDIPNLLELGNG